MLPGPCPNLYSELFRIWNPDSDKQGGRIDSITSIRALRGCLHSSKRELKQQSLPCDAFVEKLLAPGTESKNNEFGSGGVER